MKIETKFNRNDKVWVAEYNLENKKYKPLKIRITDIRIDSNCLGTEIYYFTTDTSGLYSEEYMFKTKAEAQAECDRRNNG